VSILKTSFKYIFRAYFINQHEFCTFRLWWHNLFMCNWYFV